MLCALSVSKWQRKEQLPSLPAAELKSKNRKKEEENRWKGPSGRVRLVYCKTLLANLSYLTHYLLGFRDTKVILLLIEVNMSSPPQRHLE